MLRDDIMSKDPSWPWPPRPFAEWSPAERGAFIERHADIASMGREWLMKRSSAQLRKEVERMRRLRREEEERWKEPEYRARQLAAADASYTWSAERDRTDGSFWASLEVSPQLRALVWEVQDEIDDGCGLEYVHLRAVYARTLKEHGHLSYDDKERLERHEAALLARLREHRESNWDLVVTLRESVAQLKQLLLQLDGETEPSPDVGGDLFDDRRRVRTFADPERRPSGKARAPVRLPAYEPPRKPKPLPSAARVERNDAVDARVLALLARHPDGLSLNAIEKRLRGRGRTIGRVQLRRALARLTRTNLVRHVKNGNSSLYLRTN